MSVRFRLHVPGDGWRQPRHETLDNALHFAFWEAGERRRPVHVIDTRPGGGLVTVIGPPGSWDRAS